LGHEKRGLEAIFSGEIRAYLREVGGAMPEDVSHAFALRQAALGLISKLTHILIAVAFKCISLQIYYPVEYSTVNMFWMEERLLHLNSQPAVRYDFYC